VALKWVWVLRAQVWAAPKLPAVPVTVLVALKLVVVCIAQMRAWARQHVVVSFVPRRVLLAPAPVAPSGALLRVLAAGMGELGALELIDPASVVPE
jgi:hypothetical protein